MRQALQKLTSNRALRFEFESWTGVSVACPVCDFDCALACVLDCGWTFVGGEWFSDEFALMDFVVTAKNLRQQNRASKQLSQSSRQKRRESQENGTQANATKSNQATSNINAPHDCNHHHNIKHNHRRSLEVQCCHACIVMICNHNHVSIDGLGHDGQDVFKVREEWWVINGPLG
jgi:hypothetical protein